jgi:hypothetical protein
LLRLDWFEQAAAAAADRINRQLDLYRRAGRRFDRKLEARAARGSSTLLNCFFGLPRWIGQCEKIDNGRPLGSKNKIGISVKEALDQAAARIGEDLVGFFEMAGRQKLEALGGWIVHGSVPKAKDTDDISGPRINLTLTVHVIEHGMSFDQNGNLIPQADALEQMSRLRAHLKAEAARATGARPQLVFDSGRQQKQQSD